METTPGIIAVEVGVGELLDKITILRIKTNRMSDATQLEHVRHELKILEQTWSNSACEHESIADLVAKLQEVNIRLWDIEDEIRDCEAKKDFSQRFIDLARAVYITNDERSRLKKSINNVCGSAIVEEKSYTDYKS